MGFLSNLFKKNEKIEKDNTNIENNENASVSFEPIIDTIITTLHPEISSTDLANYKKRLSLELENSITSENKNKFDKLFVK